MESFLKAKGYKLGDLNVKVTTFHLQDISRRCSLPRTWLYPHLDIDKSVVDAIDSEQKEEQDKRLHFLLKWVEIRGSEATYSVLIKALSTIGRSDDAEYVCKLVTGKRRQQMPTAVATGMAKF